MDEYGSLYLQKVRAQDNDDLALIKCGPNVRLLHIPGFLRVSCQVTRYTQSMSMTEIHTYFIIALAYTSLFIVRVRDNLLVGRGVFFVPYMWSKYMYCSLLLSPCGQHDTIGTACCRRVWKLVYLSDKCRERTPTVCRGVKKYRFPAGMLKPCPLLVSRC